MARTGVTTASVLGFVAVGLAVGLLAVVSGRPPLTVEEVLRDSGRLATLAARTRVEAPGSDAAVGVTYTFDGPCGGIRGVAVREQWTRRNRPAPPEAQLWFSLVAHPRRGFREPGRPPLPALTLLRDAAASDLVEPGEGSEVRLRLGTGDGGPGSPEATDPAPAVLGLDNLRGAPASSAQLRGGDLAALAAGGPCRLAAADLEVFTVLARVLRARICDHPDAAGSRCHDTALAIYRAVPGGRYWIDLRALGEDLGTLGCLLDVTRDRGVLWRGEARIIRQRTDLRLPADLFFSHPGPPGATLAPTDPGFRAVSFRPARRGPPDPPVEIDFVALLAGTGWAGGR